MIRKTIALSELRHNELKAAAARTGKSMAQIADEALARYGLKTKLTSLELLELAGRNSGLDDDEAMELALEVTREVRRSHYLQSAKR